MSRPSGGGTETIMNDLTYLTSHYDEKIRRIKETGAPLNFIFITDMHNRLNQRAVKSAPGQYELAANAIRSMQYILDRCPEISFVVSGGDIGNDYDPDPAKMRASHQEVMDALYGLSVPVHCVIGNHDDGIGNSLDRGNRNIREVGIFPEEMHALCMKYSPTKENYYYIDDPKLPYRFVFLNTSDKAYFADLEEKVPFGWRLEASNRQAEWLEGDALKTDREIFIFSHSPIHNAGIFGSEGMPLGIKPYDDLFNGPRIYYAIKHCPQVRAMIAGHVHYDNLLYDDRILSITSLCSFVQEWAPGCPKREFGTITETAFDVFSVTGEKLVITRFGAGEDRVGTFLR